MYLSLALLISATAAQLVVPPPSPVNNNNPTFDRGPDIFVAENSGDFTLDAWATNINDGDSTRTQGVRFFLTTSSLFSVQPQINDQGRLTFRTAKDQYGSAQITVYLRDDGERQCVAVDQPCNCNPADCSRSIERIFTIHVEFVNQCPKFGDLGNVETMEKSSTGSVTFHRNWAFRENSNTPLSGANNEKENQQRISWEIQNDNPQLFEQEPSFVNCDLSTCDLRYTPRQYHWGEANVVARMKDDGGTGSGGCDTSRLVTFRITVRFINHAPFYTPGNNPIQVQEDPAGGDRVVIANWARGVDPGHEMEDQQTLRFNVAWQDPTCAALFRTQPSMSAEGSLSWVQFSNYNTFGKTCRLHIQLEDDGLPETAHAFSCGSAGDLSSCPTVTIIVEPVNDPPFYVPGGDIEVWEDLKDLPVPPTPPAQFVRVAWATEITPGTGAITLSGSIADFEKNVEGQTTRFVVTTPTTDLFRVNPTVDTDGTLRFTLNENANGQVTCDVTVFDSLGLQGVKRQLSIVVRPSNNAPVATLALPSPIRVPQDCPPQRFTSFLTSAQPGPPSAVDEIMAQQLTIYASGVQRPELFAPAGQPIITQVGATTGQLTFQCAAGATGTSNFTVALVDNGGTARRGVDTTLITVSVEIAPNIVPPAFSLRQSGVVVYEGQCDSGCIFSGHVADISTGTNQPGSVTFAVETTPRDLFDAPPTISASGTLSFTTRANANGDASCAVTATNPTTGISSRPPSSIFTIRITPVNSPPFFVPGPSLTGSKAVSECRGQVGGCVGSLSAWATGIRKGNVGATNENHQRLFFSIDVPATAARFFASPGISIDANTGNMIFTLISEGGNTRSSGAFALTITLRDDGGVANGGQDTYVASIQFEIAAFVPSPSFQLLPVSRYMDSGTALIPDAIHQLSSGGFDGAPVSDLLSFTVSVTNGLLFSSSVTVVVGESTAALSLPIAPGVWGTSGITVLATNVQTGKTASRMGTVSVIPINHAPTFVLAKNVIDVDKNSLAVSVTGVAVGISAGPGAMERASQNVLFRVECDNPTLFETRPSLSSFGALSFAPAQFVEGTSRCGVTLSDDGGSVTPLIAGLNPPLSRDVSEPQYLSIRIRPIITAPHFVLTSLVIRTYQGFGPVLIYNWASERTTGVPGSPTINQTNANYFRFVVTCQAQSVSGSVGGNIFATNPAIDTLSGTLSFATLPTIFGTISCSVRLDNLAPDVSTAVARSAEKMVTVEVGRVDETPSISLSPPTLFVDPTQTTIFSQPNWAVVTRIPVGASAIISVTVESTTPKNALLFATPPAVSSVDYSLVVVPHTQTSGGTASFQVCLSVSGGSFVTIPGDASSVNSSVRVCSWATIVMGAPNSPPVVLITSSEVRILEKSTTSTTTVSGYFSRLEPGDEARRTGTSDFPASVTSLTVHCGSCSRSGVAVDVTAVFDSIPSGAVYSTVTISGERRVYGDLLMRPKPNEFGTCGACVARATDSAGTVGTSSTFAIIVIPVNQPPSFSLHEIEAKQPTGTQYVSTIECLQGQAIRVPWATRLSAGPANEGTQSVTFEFRWANSAEGSSFRISLSDVFSSLPAVDPTSGELSFGIRSTSPYSLVRYTFDVTMRDSGGTDNGGVDVTNEANSAFGQRFRVRLEIVVTLVNKPPTFLRGPDLVVEENSGTSIVPAWATSVTNTNGRPSAELVFIVNSSDRTLFSSQPIISSSGTLSFATAPGHFGTAVISIVLKNAGGSANGGSDSSPRQDFSILVRAVARLPAVVLRTSTIAVPMNTNFDRTRGDSAPTTLVDLVIVGDIHWGRLPSGENVSPAELRVINPEPMTFFATFGLNNTSGKVERLLLTRNTPGRFSCGIVAVSRAGTSQPARLDVEVLPVNQPPTATVATSNITIRQGQRDVVYRFHESTFEVVPSLPSLRGDILLSRFLSGIGTGDAATDNGQSLTGMGIHCNDTSVFAFNPQLANIVGSTADVLFALNSEAFGSTSCFITLVDNGGTAEGGRDRTTVVFQLHISFVNVPPTFSAQAQFVDLDFGATVLRPAFFMQISPGTSFETRRANDSVVRFHIRSATGLALFLVPPMVALDSSSTGSLSATAGHVEGSVNVSIIAEDSFGALSRPLYVFFTVAPTQSTTTMSTPPSAFARVVLDEALDSFSATFFRRTVAHYVSTMLETLLVVAPSDDDENSLRQALQQSRDTIVRAQDVEILQVRGGSVVVDFHFTKPFSSTSDADTDTDYNQATLRVFASRLNRNSQELAPMRSDLSVRSVAYTATTPAPQTATPAPGSFTANTTLVIALIVLGVLFCVLIIAILVACCIRSNATNEVDTDDRHRRRSDPRNAPPTLHRDYYWESDTDKEDAVPPIVYTQQRYDPYRRNTRDHDPYGGYGHNGEYDDVYDFVHRGRPRRFRSQHAQPQRFDRRHDDGPPPAQNPMSRGVDRSRSPYRTS